MSLNEIVKFGPFVGVASAEKSEGNDANLECLASILILIFQPF